jgi:uncharacterized membrane protein
VNPAEQAPDQRIAWKTMAGAQNDGVVTFHRIGDGRSRIMLQLEFDPQGFVEIAGDALGIVRARTHDDLERFKAFIEARGRETGEWRGSIEQDPTR